MAMNIQRVNFDPVSGDSSTAAFRKLDLDIGEVSKAIDGDGSINSGITNRVAATEQKLNGLGNASTKNVGTATGTVAAGDDGRFAANATAAANAQAAANSKLSTASPTASGTLTVNAGTLGTGVGSIVLPLNIAVSNGNDDRIRGYSYRFTAGNGWDRSIWLIRREVDGSAQGSIEFSHPALSYAVGFGDGNGATVKITTGGNMSVPGNITAGGTVTWSDETLKKNITPRAITRGMALRLANSFAEWDLIESGAHDMGVTAQNSQKICPQYVFESQYTPRAELNEHGFWVTPDAITKLSIDKTGMAFEASMDNALSIEELRVQLMAAIARIDQLSAATP